MKLERTKYSYIDKMPKNIEYFEGGLYDAIYESSCKWPHNIAIEYFETQVTYREMIKRINKVAAALKAIGAEKGERITRTESVFAGSNYALELEQMNECIAGNATPLVSEEFSIRNMQLLDTILEEVRKP